MPAKKRPSSTTTTSSTTPAFTLADSGDDNVPVKPGTGEELSVYFLLKTLEVMKWEIEVTEDPATEEKKATIITIPSDAPWQIAIDKVTNRAYLEAENKVLRGIEVRHMVDNNGVNVSSIQTPKQDEQFEIIFKLATPIVPTAS